MTKPDTLPPELNPEIFFKTFELMKKVPVYQDIDTYHPNYVADSERVFAALKVILNEQCKVLNAENALIILKFKDFEIEIECTQDQDLNVSNLIRVLDEDILQKDFDIRITHIHGDERAQFLNFKLPGNEPKKPEFLLAIFALLDTLNLV